MARPKSRTDSAPGVRRSTRLIDNLIDKANGTTRPRNRRPPEPLEFEDNRTPTARRKRSVSRRTPSKPTQDNESQTRERKRGRTSAKMANDDNRDNGPIKTNSNAGGKKVKQQKSKSSRSEQKKTASKKDSQTKTKPASTRSRASSSQKSGRARSSQGDGESKTTRSSKRSTTRSKGGEIRDDIGDVKPGGFVSALGKRKTPWEVSGDEADARRLRATQHRLFLVGRRDSAQDLADDNLTYIVMGTTGNIYYCTFTSQTIRCTCVDQRVRKVFCKHLLFVMFKVLKIPQTHPVTRRKYAEMSSDELAEMYAISRQSVPDSEAVAPERVRQAWQSATGQAPTLDDQEVAEPAPQREVASDDDCPICFEPLDDGEPLEFCKGLCGRSVHAECFGKWAALKKRDNEPVTCVYCRQPWVGEQTAEDRKIKRSRLNLESYVES